jgi:1,3-beta-glucan synthase subunit FKS1, domain-1
MSIIIDLNMYMYTQEARKSKTEKAKHSQWRNYDDLNEYFWY